MEMKKRIVRFAVALAVAGAIATQIPMNGGTALARDGYGGRGGTGDTGRNVLRAAVAATVGYGLYSTAVAAPVAGAAPTIPPVAGGGGGAPIAPATTAKPIWDVSNERDDLNRFAQTASDAGEKENLRKDGQFTAFVPNNAAFADLGDTKLQDLARPENKAKLAALIDYHVIVGAYTIDQLKSAVRPAGVDGKKFATIGGGSVTLKMSGDVLSINGVRIIEADYPASNGVIHPIGQVLDPEAATTPVAPAPTAPVVPPAN